jgi:hypothetical protein
MLRLLGQTLLEEPISIKLLVTRFKSGYAVSPKLRSVLKNFQTWDLNFGLTARISENPSPSINTKVMTTKLDFS